VSLHSRSGVTVIKYNASNTKYTAVLLQSTCILSIHQHIISAVYKACNIWRQVTQTLAPVNWRSCSCAFKSLFICKSSRAYKYIKTNFYHLAL